MKNFYEILFFLGIVSIAQAQTDTTFQKNSVELGVFENQKIVDARKHIFNSIRDEKNMFRLGVESVSLPLDDDLLLLPTANSLFVAYEQRIKTGFSLNSQLAYQLAYQLAHMTTAFENQNMDAIFFIHSWQNVNFFIEPRWYFRQKNRVEANEIGNNLNGIYASLQLGSSWRRIPISSINTDVFSFETFRVKGNFHYSTLNVGMQRRFGKHGFLHFQLGAGAKYNAKQEVENISNASPTLTIDPLPKWQWLATYRVGVGLAFGGKPIKNIPNAILEYYREDNDLWKIDLYSILRGIGGNGVAGKINIGYERNIIASSFSINTNLSYAYRKSIENRGGQNLLQLQIATRYYYNLKKRTRKGKAANNLSGDYLSLRHNFNLNRTNEFAQRYLVHALWGMQRNILKNMFINYQLGYQFRTGEFGGGELLSELKIGLAF